MTDAGARCAASVLCGAVQATANALTTRASDVYHGVVQAIANAPATRGGSAVNFKLHDTECRGRKWSEMAVASWREHENRPSIGKGESAIVWSLCSPVL